VTVALVFTERHADLTESRVRNFERLRAGLTGAGATVVESWYEDVDPQGLARADAIVLSGSSAPWSAHEPPQLDRLCEAVRSAGRPVLGICAGFQLQARFAGGTIGAAATPEHGLLPIEVHDRSDLFRDLPDEVVVFHDHTDEITELPAGFRVLASSAACAVQAIADPERRWWGTQFHPEESPVGERILRTFLELAR
jgi:GMP synthase (glutamine-hydrolysing) A subunit